MNVCYQCQDEKNQDFELENDEIFELCQKCGTAYYDSDQIRLRAEREMENLFQQWRERALALFRKT